MVRALEEFEADRELSLVADTVQISGVVVTYTVDVKIVVTKDNVSIDPERDVEMADDVDDSVDCVALVMPDVSKTLEYITELSVTTVLAVAGAVDTLEKIEYVEITKMVEALVTDNVVGTLDVLSDSEVANVFAVEDWESEDSPLVS